ncbi:MAG: lytic transglycosylase domain-containing protein [Azoarcus sp.]|jgi:soluble lytic murein transglycosylase|nr:lytic transglycosylase domain-containing protein [Azoarcus sp.]
MSQTIIRTVSRVLAACAAACFWVAAHAQPGDSLTSAESRFLAARDAARSGNLTALEEFASWADGSPLDIYIRYWLVSISLSKSSFFTPETEIQQFLSKEAGSLLAERLRGEWLRRLARNQDWSRFLQVYRDLQKPDDDLRCLSWEGRIATGDKKAFDEIVKVWPSLTFAPAACMPVLRMAVSQGKVSNDEAWRLFRRRVDTRGPARAKAILAWFSDGSGKMFDQAVRNPKRYLDRTAAKSISTRVGQEMALTALTRLARDDVSAAHSRFLRLSGRLTNEQRAYGWAMLALHAAQDHMPEAVIWFNNAGNIPMSATQRAWRVRAALRTENWQDVLSTISSLTADERSQPEWVYWRGRALKALKRLDEANREFQSIAGAANFYGLLANEELGRPFDPRKTYLASVAALDTPTEAADDSDGGADAADAGSDENAPENGGGGVKDGAMEAGADALAVSAPAATLSGPPADKHPGFQRALAFYRLDMRKEAIQEWNWALRGRDEAFRLAAARLALNNHIYDRAITSAELANPGGAWDLRFLTPYRELIEPRANINHLDLAWVYGVMRQESRFIIPSRSPTGAQGLMQVMPATGKFVARKMGLYYHPGLLRDPETNVEIGTGYMRMILDELEDDYILAAAGYNAGPGRARRWRSAMPLEGAIYVETIPFEETRDYVKHVMSNTVIYAALLQGKPQSLKTRLGTIMPKPGD